MVLLSVCLPTARRTQGPFTGKTHATAETGDISDREAIVSFPGMQTPRLEEHRHGDSLEITVCR